MIATALAWMLLSAAPQTAVQTAPAPAPAPVPVQSAPAQPSSAQDESVTRLGDLVVDGQASAAPLRDRAQTFVETLSEPPRGKALGRWNTRVCVGVANMPAAAAQTVIDRIAVVGGVLGVQFGRPGCKAEVMIIAAHTADADRAIHAALDREGEYFFRPARGGTDLGSEALRTFAGSSAPVRWWHVAMPVNADTGQPAITLDGEDAVIEFNGSDPGSNRINATQINSATRLRSAIRNDLNRAIIVIDVDKAGDVPLSALADYLTLITLAQIDPSADVSQANTILNLFSATGGARPTGLTEWDAAFLVALYDSDPNPGILSHQRRDIGARVTRLIGRETH